MATLEKIRSKSVFLLVIIGVALLAFIIGDFFNSGRTIFGTGTTVAKVDGRKIDIQEFQRRIEQANQQLQQQGRQMDHAVVQQQVLNGMINEVLYKDEIKRLGIVVTDNELTEAMLGENSGMVDSYVRQQTGIDGAAALHDMAFNPTKYQISAEQAQQLREYWVSLEKQLEEQLLQQKFFSLVQGALVANELDAKALYDENASTYHVAYTQKGYTSLTDEEKYQASDAEIEKEWNKMKARFVLPDQMRYINYISVGITPSAEDITAAEQKVENVLAALNEQPDLEGVADATEFVADRQKTAVSSIRDARIRDFAKEATPGTAQIVFRTGNDFTLAKLFNRGTEVDSINVDFIIVQGDKLQADSVITALNSGAKMADLGNISGVAQAQDSLWLSLLDPQLGQLKQVLENATAGVAFTPDTAATLDSHRVIRVNTRRPAVATADLAVINFTVEPSGATVANLRAALDKYTKENPKAEDFVANAQEAGYQVFPTVVSASTPMITGLNDSRNAIAWAMKAKKGQVSPVMGDQQNGGRYIAVALTDIYDDYTPARDPQVKGMLSAKIRDRKKADELIGQYQGKANDLAGYAALMEANVDSATISFGQVTPFYPGFAGAKAAALASISEQGALVGPMQGSTGVVVFEVTGVDNEGRPYDFKESAANYARTRGAQPILNNIYAVLLGNKKVTNNILKFFSE